MMMIDDIPWKTRIVEVGAVNLKNGKSAIPTIPKWPNEANQSTEWDVPRGDWKKRWLATTVMLTLELMNNENNNIHSTLDC